MMSGRGQPRSRRVRSGSSTSAGRGSISSTPRTSTRTGSRRRSSGKALNGGRRDTVVLATKVGLPFDGTPTTGGASGAGSSSPSDRSLQRLGTDWIDCIDSSPRPGRGRQRDARRPLGLPSPGKDPRLRCLDVPASAIVEAQWTAERRGRERFRYRQPPYSLLARQIESDVLPTACATGMASPPNSPLAMGWLSGSVPQGPAGAPPAAPALRGRFDGHPGGHQRSSMPPTHSAALRR